MAARSKATEPATPDSEPAASDRVFDPRVMVYVHDTNTGKKLDRPVPETWLDGRFPQLSQNPSTLKGGK